MLSWEDSGPHLQEAHSLLLGLSGNLMTHEGPSSSLPGLQVGRTLRVAGSYYSVFFTHLSLATEIYKQTSGNVIQVTFRNRRNYSNNSRKGLSRAANSGSQLIVLLRMPPPRLLPEQPC